MQNSLPFQTFQKTQFHQNSAYDYTPRTWQFVLFLHFVEYQINLSVSLLQYTDVALKVDTWMMPTALQQSAPSASLKINSQEPAKIFW